MTAQDIVKVAITVTITQIVIDLMARQFIFKKEPYQRALKALERATAKHDKLVKEKASKSAGKQQDKVQKRLDLAKDDMGEAKAEVSKRHSGPGIISGVVFMVMFRVLGAEHSGKIIGVLPFVPWSVLRRITLRGLDFGADLGASSFEQSTGVDSVHQACSFILIYFLCNMGIKFYVHKLVGEPPAPGVEGGMMGVLESPQITKSLRQMGLDPEELKMA